MAPTLSRVEPWAMLESPTMTCMRRYRSASACGSSRVLMSGRERVVAEETASSIWSARWEKTKTASPWGPVITCPAPTRIWRVTR